MHIIRSSKQPTIYLYIFVHYQYSNVSYHQYYIPLSTLPKRSAVLLFLAMTDCLDPECLLHRCDFAYDINIATAC